jgi:glycosyltransferase involved in cell wall biosynthesis
VLGAVEDAAYFTEVTRLADTLGVADRVIFAGRRDDVPQMLKASRLFYLPSRSEGLSNAMLEAMACSLPCVATNVGGNRELVSDQVNGYLVPSDDPEAAAGRILSLLRDASLRAQMGRAGRRVAVERFGAEAMMCRLVELYDQLLAGRLRHAKPGPAIRAATVREPN